MAKNDQRAPIIISFNLGLIIFGLIFLITTVEEWGRGEILSLSGLVLLLVTMVIFAISKYRSAMKSDGL